VPSEPGIDQLNDDACPASQASASGLHDEEFKRNVQSGSDEWERRMFFAAMITDGLPPVSLASSLVNSGPLKSSPSKATSDDSPSPDRSVDAGEDIDALLGLAEEAEESLSTVPSTHPITGKPLLYMWPHATCKRRTMRSDDDDSRNVDEEAVPCMDSFLAEFFNRGQTVPVQGVPTPGKKRTGRSTGILKRATSIHSEGSGALPGSQTSHSGASQFDWDDGLVGSGSTSPFPHLDAWVLELAESHGGPRARIRQWQAVVMESATSSSQQDFDSAVSEPPPRTCRIFYSMSGNRYCRRVRRQHKSNNINFSVDLGRGTVIQTCMDFDCRGYRSDAIPIPLAVLDACDVEHLGQ